ncbi:hypothetical protein VI817_004895 [Penicillium citrinum]|nr:hypothetical protein VI817_004895 [Penicillium citrinum]
MVWNYDYPPASSRRSSRPSRSSDDSEPLLSGSLRQRGQWILNALDEEESDPNSAVSGVGDDLYQIMEELAPGLIESTMNETFETPRELARPPRDRLSYLRNLIHSESNRSTEDATTRALEALNQEIEEHNQHDQARGSGRPERAPGQLRPVGFHRRILDPTNPGRMPSNFQPAPSAQEPSPTNRLIRRRSFRPNFREISDTIPTPSLMPQPTQTNRDERRERGMMKRRKLDTDDNREGIRGFNYGQYGQVVPGALKMEIASCDEGAHNTDGLSIPQNIQNILRNDRAVYRTKVDRCNLILRHQGEAPFCLKKLVIKAPRRSGCNSLIQEGMVFVSMASDELLARTAQYQMQNSGVYRRQNRRRTRVLPSQEYLNSYRPPLQSLGRNVPTGPNSQSTTDIENTGRNANDRQTEFRVTTDYNENSEDSVFLGREDDEGPSIAELERIQEEDLFDSGSEDGISDDDNDEEEEEDGEEEEDDDNEGDEDNEDERGLNIMSRRRRELQRQDQPSLIDPIPPPPTGGPGGASGSEILKPHARFFIDRNRSMVSIKFDPPPSGRFILIKLWRSQNADNLDIESIIAHGYAGPRFFPSGGFR